MALDLNKYRALFLEEATDHLGEMSRALLELEKEPESGESIDTIFRMAHSTKSMAASLGYDGISELAHALEDRMERVRQDGRVASGGLGVLFRGLEQLEAMVEQVRATGDAPASADPNLLAHLSAVDDAAATDRDPNPGAELPAAEAAATTAAASPSEHPESPPEKKARS